MRHTHCCLASRGAGQGTQTVRHMVYDCTFVMKAGHGLARQARPAAIACERMAHFGIAAGVWGKLIVAWLDELLPPDAAEICQGRLKLIVTNIPSFRQAYVSDYTSKQDLINANMASVSLPMTVVLVFVSDEKRNDAC